MQTIDAIQPIADIANDGVFEVETARHEPILIDIRHPDAFALAARHIRREAILVQFPAVFVLLAAPNSDGAARLDSAKRRLPGKTYGTLIGDLQRFVDQADHDRLPAEFRTADDFEPMTGTFVRLPFRTPEFESATLRGETHQGVLVEGIHRELARHLETVFIGDAPDRIWGGSNYTGMLCTSANFSGHPEGSIVEHEKALEFARAQGIGLFLTCTDRSEELGSYPIFGYEQDAVRIHREGPFLEQYKDRIPAALRTW
ncbi:MAG: hypothetical protein ACKO5K_01430 [Armatimonadota bacterium]